MNDNIFYLGILGVFSLFLIWIAVRSLKRVKPQNKNRSKATGSCGSGARAGGEKNDDFATGYVYGSALSSTDSCGNSGWSSGSSGGCGGSSSGSDSSSSD